MQQLTNKTRLWLGAKRVVYLNYNHKDKTCESTFEIKNEFHPEKMSNIFPLLEAENI